MLCQGVTYICCAQRGARRTVGAASALARSHAPQSGARADNAVATICARRARAWRRLRGCRAAAGLQHHLRECLRRVVGERRGGDPQRRRSGVGDGLELGGQAAGDREQRAAPRHAPAASRSPTSRSQMRPWPRRLDQHRRKDRRGAALGHERGLLGVGEARKPRASQRRPGRRDSSRGRQARQRRGLRRAARREDARWRTLEHRARARWDAATCWGEDAVAAKGWVARRSPAAPRTRP